MAEMKQLNEPTRRVTAARIAGFEGDTKAFTRLVIESHVNRAALNAAWAAGVESARRMLGDPEAEVK
jgi:hypothetical protein